MLPLTWDQDRLPVQWLAADAKTGVIYGFVPVSSGATCSMAIGTGDCDVTVDLGLRTRDGTDWDRSAIAALWQALAVGKSTLIAIQGRQVLGEWLITESDPQDQTTVRFTGASWEAHPDRNQVNVRYSRIADVADAAATLLRGGFAGITITIPALTKMGVNVTLSVDVGASSWASALEQILEGNPLEWRVRPTLVWSGGVPIRVVRTVQWGVPELSAASPLVAVQPSAGVRGGSAGPVARKVSLSRAVTTVTVLGCGSGSKQVKGSWTSSYATGMVPVTRTYSDATAVDLRTANRIAAAHAAESDTDLHEPPSLPLRLDGLAGWPEPGDQIAMRIGWTPACPDPPTGTVRAGKVSWTVAAGAVDKLSVEVAE